MEKITKEEIERLYNGEFLTIPEIAKMYDTNYSAMYRLFKKLGVETRERGNIKGKEYEKNEPYNKQKLTEEQKEKISNMFINNIPCKEIYTKLGISRRSVDRVVKELDLKRTASMASREQYDASKDANICQLYKDGKSTTEIAKELGTTHRTVQKHLRHCNMTIRTISDAQFTHNNKEKPEEIDDYEKLYDMYIINRMTKKEIAANLGVAPNVIDRRLRKFNITVRGTGEAHRGLMTGDKHPNWKGGTTSLYGRVREVLHTKVSNETLKRDKYTCQICGSKKHLQVHHIRHFKDIFYEILSEHSDYDIINSKEELFQIIINDSRMLDMSNLVTYCRDCHLFKVHGYKRKEM